MAALKDIEMARSRNIKPSFFTNDVLGELEPLARLLFAGMWCHADRLGRMDDRPKKLKVEILPYDDCDAHRLIQCLHDAKMVQRYVIDGKGYIQIINFLKHQNPHIKEQESTIPAPDMHQTCTEVARLIPSSLIPSSLSLDSSPLIPDSGLPDPDSKPTKVKPIASDKPPAQKKEVDSALQATCKAVWQSYGQAYQDRYGVPPVRNAQINSKVKAFCQRIPASDSQHVAAWYLSHNAQRYVSGGHVFGLLLLDAEKLRTEWATNRKITSSQARLSDQTEGRGQVWGALIAEAEERERNGTDKKTA